MNMSDKEDGVCPMCGDSFSMDKLPGHASYCNGKESFPHVSSKKRKHIIESQRQEATPKTSAFFNLKKLKSESCSSSSKADNKGTTTTLTKEWFPNSSFSKERRDNNGHSNPPSKSPAPLAERMRPTDFSAYAGQEKVLGRGSVIRSLLEDVTQMPSLLVWGPPGCGKTTLANILATSAKASGSVKFVKMSAVTCGVSEVKEVVQTAKTELKMFKRKTILFLDEVHRFNKTQQDHFLPHIESGTIIFISATTENPSISLNNALLSRCKLISLEKLSATAVYEIIKRALDQENVEIVDGLDVEKVKGHLSVTVTDEAVQYLSNIVDGDARAALTYLEMVINISRSTNSQINLEMVGSAVSKTSVKYDRKGDQHYFMASALQKSIRGSDDSAALYWLGRMLRGGEDPAFIGRRLVRCASEDIGLADNSSLALAVSAMQGAQLLGRPECDVLLAQATVHLARAPKSHEVYAALTNVYEAIDNPGPGGLPDVPLHLRQGGGRVGKEQGWGVGYSSDLGKVKNVDYMPTQLKGQNFFRDPRNC